MDKERNEIGEDVVGRSKTTEASPRGLLNFLKKMNQRSRKMNQPYKKLRSTSQGKRRHFSDIKNVETNMNVGPSMWNARPLAEFNQSGWTQVDFAPLINYTRKKERQHIAKQVEYIFDQQMSGESIQNMFEKEREEDDEGCNDQIDKLKICDEEREEYNRDEPSDSKDKWEKIRLKLEGYRLCAIESHTLAKQDMEVLKDEGKSE
jgi:hypothetical protein